MVRPLYRRGLTNAEAKVLNSGDEAQGFFRIERAGDRSMQMHGGYGKADGPTMSLVMIFRDNSG